MGHVTRKAMAVMLGLALSACGQQKAAEHSAMAQDNATSATATPAAAQPPMAFGQCRSCHSLERGKTLLGPSLFAIVGKPAGHDPAFAYSSALKASGLIWDKATLDAWLTAPGKLVPGTRMVFPGIPDPAARKAIIDYLSTQE